MGSFWIAYILNTEGSDGKIPKRRMVAGVGREVE
jgi:hypothetical protein